MLNRCNNEKHQVGAVITKLMNKASMDESSLARACNISLASLSRIKNNPNSNPTISTLRPIAEFFNITIDQLLGYSPLEDNASTLKNIAVIKDDDVSGWLEQKTTKNPIQQWLIYDGCASDLTFAIEHSTNLKTNINNNLLERSLLLVDPKRNMQHDDLILIFNKKVLQFFIRKISIDDQGEVHIKPIEDGFSQYTPLSSCSSNIIPIGVILETRLQYCLKAAPMASDTEQLAVEIV